MTAQGGAKEGGDHLLDPELELAMYDARCASNRGKPCAGW